MGIHMAHYTMKGGSPLLEDSLCTVRLNGSPGPLPSRPLLASFHSPAFPPLSSVFIDLMADLSSPLRLPLSQQQTSSPSFLDSALLLGRAAFGPVCLLLLCFLSILIILPGFPHLHMVSGVLFLQILGSYPCLEQGRDFVPCELTDSSVTSLCDSPCGMSSWVAITRWGVANPGAGDIRSLR